MGFFKWLKKPHSLKFSLLSSGDLTALEKTLKWILIMIGINFFTNIILLIFFTQK